MENKSANSGCFGALGVIITFCAVMFVWICFAKVPANKIGVRTNASGGIEKHDFKPGFVFCVPWLHTVRLWDPTWNNVLQRMEVRGSDQYKTSIDVSVIYRIHQDKCNEVAGTFPDETRIASRVKSSLAQYANEILTEMRTEDFYNATVREQKCSAVQKKMDEQLEPNGLEVRSVLMRNILYDQSFEEQLIKKQIAGQTLSLEKSKILQAQGETQTELIEKEAQNKVISIKETLEQEIKGLTAENEQQVNKIIQDANLKAAELVAKATANNRLKKSNADLLRAQATAAGTAALSKVYARPGANFYFAQKSIQGLKLGTIEVNSNTFNPLDTDHLIKALGVELKK